LVETSEHSLHELDINKEVGKMFSISPKIWQLVCELHVHEIWPVFFANEVSMACPAHRFDGVYISFFQNVLSFLNISWPSIVKLKCVGWRNLFG